jgi:hypothetical protein
MKTHPFLRFADRAHSRGYYLDYPLCDRRSRQQQTGLPGLSSQALAALGATCVQHCTATTGCHTGAETMSALAAYDGRLVSTFHYGLANQQKINRIITPNTRLSKCDRGRRMLMLLTPWGHNRNSNIAGSEPVIRQHFSLACQSFSVIRRGDWGIL